MLLNCKIWLQTVVKFRKYSHARFGNFLNICIMCVNVVTIKEKLPRILYDRHSYIETNCLLTECMTPFSSNEL